MNLRNFLLALNLLFLISCSHTPIATSFDGTWEFRQCTPEQELKACLGQDDLIRLKTVLVRCESQ